MHIVKFKDKNGRTKKSFKVIPENNVVVGKSFQLSLLDELGDFCTKTEIDFLPSYIVFDGAEEYGSIRKMNYAKAKCDPRDEWNEKTGIDVCSAKLDLKEHLRKAKKLDKALVIMNSIMRKMEDLCQKHKQKAKAIRKDLEDYYGGIYK